jgi:hypothetical protein
MSIISLIAVDLIAIIEIAQGKTLALRTARMDTMLPPSP